MHLARMPHSERSTGGIASMSAPLKVPRSNSAAAAIISIRCCAYGVRTSRSAASRRRGDLGCNPQQLEVARQILARHAGIDAISAVLD